MGTPPENEPSSTLPTISLTGFERSAAREELAAERARLLLGCYRRFDAMDPDTYVLAIATVLAVYDEWVILEATHPRTGIQATEKFMAWPPNSGELKAFCDDMAKRSARYAIYDRLPKPNVAPFQPTLPALPPVDRDARPTVEELAQRHADMRWAQLILQRMSNAGPRTPEQRLRAYNDIRADAGLPPVTQAQFDAIPDAKKAS